MKNVLRVACCVGAGLCLVGCLQYRPAMYPLQPGDAIVFGQTNRANEFRRKSGNDSYEFGAKVLITRPTLVQCE